MELSVEAVGAAAGVVLLGTVGAYALNAWALARTGASTTAFFIYIQPLFAGVLAYLVLGENAFPAPLRRRGAHLRRRRLRHLALPG